MANFSGFGNAFQGAANATSVLQQQDDARRQAQAQSMLARILQQYAAAPQGSPQSQGAMSAPSGAPQAPAVPSPGGVSPSGAGPAPAAGPSGGAGPTSPMGGGPAPNTGLDLQNLVKAVMAQGGNPGAQGYALQAAMKTLQPQANNAVKIDLQNNKLADADKNKALDRQTRMELQDKILAGRKTIAALEQRNGGLRNDPIYQALKQKAAVAQDQVKVTMGSDDALAAAAKANDDLMAYAKQLASGGSKQPSPQSAPAAPASNAPTGTVVDAVTGAGAGDGSEKNPIIVQTQSDIDTAKSGTWLNVNGQLYQKP